MNHDTKNHDTNADDMAHKRLRGDLDKLFGVRPQMRKDGADREEQLRKNRERLFPTLALRKEYAASDEGGRMLMLLEVALEAMADPAAMAKRTALAKIEADTARLRRCVEITKREIEALIAEVAAYGFLRDSAPPMQLRKEVRDSMAASLEKIEQSTATIAAALRDAGVVGVGELAAAPFSAPIEGHDEAFAFAPDVSSAWAIPRATLMH